MLDSSNLDEPLLAEHDRSQRGSTPLHRSSTPASVSSSCPPSFKASKPRKHKHFIDSERSNSRKLVSCEPPGEALDSRLLSDEDAPLISEKVALLLFRHLEEGRAAGLDHVPSKDDFHESHFLRPRCCGWCPRRQRGTEAKAVSQTAVLGFINDLAASLYFCKQVIVLCAIYIEKLLHGSTVTLTRGNWRSLVIAGLIIASKVWEDVHPWNADFAECLADVAGLRYARGALYRLEALFLEKLRWEVYVDGEVYASYFFALIEKQKTIVSDERRAFRPKARRSRFHSDSFDIEPILENEIFQATEVALKVEYWSTCSGVEQSDAGSVDEAGSRLASGGNARSLPSVAMGDIVPAAAQPSSLSSPRSAEEVVEDWKQRILSGGDAGTLTSSALRDAWSLDARNPYVGALRHAPRAPAPSRHILDNAETRWANELATRTAEVLGPPRPSTDLKSAVQTVSGVTGSQLATELRNYIGGRANAAAGTATASDVDTLAGIFAQDA